MDELIAALLQPARLPGTGEPASLLETHISWVLLAGEHAYKIKKPVNLGFLDFSSLEARRGCCEAELRLNRRTAPDLYLDVLPLTGTRSAPVIGGAGEPIEYLLRMRRFEQEALLDSMARRGALQPAHLERLAASIEGFHRGLPAAPVELGYGTAERVFADAMQNFDQLRELGADDALLGDLRDWTRREHARLAPVFESRLRGGFVRECHGDLHLGNIVMLGGTPTPFDCIEFNDAFRWIDVINEVAFLVMDLREHGLPGHAHAFLDAYLEAGGDYAGVDLLRYYIVYRAMVRAKVARMRARQARAGAASEAEGASAGAEGAFPRPAGAQTRLATEYRAYLELAREAAAPGRGALILMHGLSGSGKSTVARDLGAGLRALRLRSDIERKRLHRLAPLARTGADIGEGIYAPGSSDLTYDRLADLARPLIARGYPVIIDAAFLDRGRRLRFRDLARELGAPFAIVACTAPEALLRERIARRAREGADASDAGLRVLEQQLAAYNPLSGDESADALAVDAAGTHETVAALAAKLRTDHGFPVSGKPWSVPYS